VTKDLIDRAARALVPHVAGALPEDQWTKDAAKAILKAVLSQEAAEAYLAAWETDDAWKEVA
jgi:hypothetical protein